MEPPFVVLIDNYDSFTYNLYEYFCQLTPAVQVFRNDKVDIPEIARLRPDLIVISPGPKAPRDAGISKEVISRLGHTIPILGVCLGHQCINEVFGGSTVRAPCPWHGKTSIIHHDGKVLYDGVPDGISVARYHSLVADPKTIGPDLYVSAWTEDGIVMGLRHHYYPIEGVQFHPESFMTEYGQMMLRNYLTRVRRENFSAS
ncbi:MAG TPA: aminodeoxychorismate/anthranilate synthase component II [Blastocatellia bacterium]|jgi:anthranilate synthase/aminodeoxychorismate synthase-like glutamine amidotransferase